MSELNDRIKEMRLRCGLTLLEVAEKIGVKEATVQRYESGAIKNIKHETVCKLAEVFGCDPGNLMGWEEKSNISEVYTDGMYKIPVFETVSAGSGSYPGGILCYGRDFFRRNRFDWRIPDRCVGDWNRNSTGELRTGDPEKLL